MIPENVSQSKEMTPSPDAGPVAGTEEEQKEKPTSESKAVALVTAVEEEEKEFSISLAKPLFGRLIEGQKQAFIRTDKKKINTLLQKCFEELYDTQLHLLPDDLRQEYQLQTSFATQLKRQFFFNGQYAVVVACTEYDKLRNQEGKPRFDNMKEGKEEAEFMVDKLTEMNYEVKLMMNPSRPEMD